MLGLFYSRYLPRPFRDTNNNATCHALKCVHEQKSTNCMLRNYSAGWRRMCFIQGVGTVKSFIHALTLFLEKSRVLFAHVKVG
jgi:hypothetical protein